MTLVGVDVIISSYGFYVEQGEKALLLFFRLLDCSAQATGRRNDVSDSLYLVNSLRLYILILTFVRIAVVANYSGSFV